MKRVRLIGLLGALLVAGATPNAAAFSSFYVFGDGVCTTTNGPGDPVYYGNRFSNGRVWVEVLAERQGLVCDSNNNWSYFGHYSSNLVVNLGSYVPPADSNNVLYVVWVCDADFVADVRDYGTNVVQWTNSINRSLSNHFTIITNLYHAKGARTLIMPNAVDLGKVPYYVNYEAAKKSFIRQQTMDFNTRFATLLATAEASLPGLTIYSPDIFSLLDDVVANPAKYGLIKPTTYVIEDLPGQWELDGPGTNYVFWDDLDPTAMFHAHVADYVQQSMTPVRIASLANQAGTNWLVVTNVPIGQNGFVEGSTDLTSWSSMTNIISTNVTQAVSVPVSGPKQFYRLRFPFVWVFP